MIACCKKSRVSWSTNSRFLTPPSKSRPATPNRLARWRPIMWSDGVGDRAAVLARRSATTGQLCTRWLRCGASREDEGGRSVLAGQSAPFCSSASIRRNTAQCFALSLGAPFVTHNHGRAASAPRHPKPPPRGRGPVAAQHVRQERHAMRIARFEFAKRQPAVTSHRLPQPWHVVELPVGYAVEDARASGSVPSVSGSPQT